MISYVNALLAAASLIAASLNGCDNVVFEQLGWYLCG